jgi:hypothetical protein
MGWCEPAARRRQSCYRLLPSFLVDEVVAASSRFLSVEISFDFVTGSKWANPVPQRWSVMTFFEPTSLHDV